MPKLLITFFGLGLLPVAPGTAGSLGAAVVWIVLRLAYGASGWPGLWFEVMIVALVMAVSYATVVWGDLAAEMFGREDPGQCVSDEVAGQWVALLWLPAAAIEHNLIAVVAMQFVLFRVFDILKPPPVRQLESCRGGWGILLDDLAAGVYANLIGQIVLRYVWSGG